MKVSFCTVATSAEDGQLEGMAWHNISPSLSMWEELRPFCKGSPFLPNWHSNSFVGMSPDALKTFLENRSCFSQSPEKTVPMSAFNSLPQRAETPKKLKILYYIQQILAEPVCVRIHPPSASLDPWTWGVGMVRRGRIQT
jgi:hypothetical protein